MVYTLETGATITIASPAGANYQYQIGSGEVMDYAALRTAVGTRTTADPFTVPLPSSNAAPELSAIAGSLSIAENTAYAADTDAGLTFTATDADDTLAVADFTVYEGGSTTASTRFKVVADADTTNGWKIQISAGAGFDRETDGGTLTLKVVASDDGGATAAQTVNVTITDVNDVTPVLGTAGTAGLAENADGGTTPVDTGLELTVTDADAATTNNFTEASFTVYENDSTDTQSTLFDVKRIGDKWKLVYIGSGEDYESSTTSHGVDVYVTDGTNSSAKLDATIPVTNVNEEGAIGPVTGTARVGQTLTAGTVSDPDGTASALVYEWLWRPRGSSDSYALAVDGTHGTYGNGQEANTFTPNGALDGAEIVVLVTYTAGGFSDSVVMSAAFQLERVIDAPTGTQAVAENTATKTTVATVAITDDGEALTAAERAIVTAAGTGVRLTGDDRFAIEHDSGDNFNIFLKAGQTLDYETEQSVTLTVHATNSDTETATRNVIITITDVNDVTPVLGSSGTASLAENADGGTTPVDTGLELTVTDADAATTNNFTEASFTVYENDSTDTQSTLFDVKRIGDKWKLVYIGAGEDYESSTTSHGVDVYVTDGTNSSAKLDVTVDVTDADDPGSVAVTGTARVGETLTAGAVSDPDGTVTISGRQWQRADTADGTYAAISGATGSTYTLTDADVGKFIRFEVSYTAGAFTGSTATSAPTAAIATDAAPVIDTPAGTQAVDENTATKTTVATVAITDDGEALTAAERAIVSAAGTGVRLSGDTRFGIEHDSGDNFNIFLKAGQTLDYETEQSVTLTVHATDSNGGTTTRDVPVTVNNVNEEGSITVTSSIGTVQTNRTLTAGTITDPDGTAIQSSIVWLWQWSITDSWLPAEQKHGLGQGTNQFTPNDSLEGARIRACHLYGRRVSR